MTFTVPATSRCQVPPPEDDYNRIFLDSTLQLAKNGSTFGLAQGRTNPSPGALMAGTRLYRSWRGVTQEILVLESGYGWRGKSYASLSEVARAITGTRWSGPRFFGLQA
jgi:hypothetical protein